MEIQDLEKLDDICENFGKELANDKNTITYFLSTE